MKSFFLRPGAFPEIRTNLSFLESIQPKKSGSSAEFVGENPFGKQR